MVFLTLKIDGYQNKCETNKNVTKMDMIKKYPQNWPQVFWALTRSVKWALASLHSKVMWS